MFARIRVVEIIYSFGVAGPGGGAARFGMELSRNLDPERFEVTICGLWNYGTILEQKCIESFRRENIEAFTAANWDPDHPYSCFWKAYHKLQSFLSLQAANILHSHSEFGDPVALLMKLSRKSPIIVRTVHNGYRHEWRDKPLRRLLLTNLLYPLTFAAEIGVNRGIVNTLNRRWLSRLWGKKAIYLPNAVDFSRFTGFDVDPAVKRAALHIPADAFVVGTIGRLVEEKGYKFFLESAAVVLKKVPNTYFLLIGGGELASELKSLASQLGIEDHVRFSGPRLDIEKVLACLDLFVSSSLWEGLSTAVLEAMGSEVPIVATNIPGNKEIIQNRSSGWLVAPEDSASMALAITEALQNPSQRSEYARRALSIKRAFSIDVIATKHESLYIDLQT